MSSFNRKNFIDNDRRFTLRVELNTDWSKGRENIRHLKGTVENSGRGSVIVFLPTL